ncbi:uncharacterized protein LOC144128362 [Amblyomma americanum]
MPEKEEQGQPLETTEALTSAGDLGLMPSSARTPPNLEPPRDIKMSSVPTTGASQLPMVSSQSQEESSTSNSPLPEPAPRPSSAPPRLGRATSQQTALPLVVGRSREQHQPQAGPQPQPQLQPQRQFVGWPHGNAERFYALHVPSLQDYAPQPQPQLQPQRQFVGWPHGNAESFYALHVPSLQDYAQQEMQPPYGRRRPGDNYSLSWDPHARVGNVLSEDNFYSGRPYGTQSPPRPQTTIHSARHGPELQWTPTDASFVQLLPQRESPLSRQEPPSRRERPASPQGLSSQQDRQSLLHEDLLSEHEQPLLRSYRPQQQGMPRVELDAIRLNGRPYVVRNARRSADDPRAVIIECYAALERPT